MPSRSSTAAADKTGAAAAATTGSVMPQSTSKTGAASSAARRSASPRRAVHQPASNTNAPSPAAVVQGASTASASRAHNQVVAAPAANAPRASPRLAQKVKRSERALAEEAAAASATAGASTDVPASAAATPAEGEQCPMITDSVVSSGVPISAAAGVVASVSPAAALPASSMPLLRSTSTLMSPPASVASASLSTAAAILGSPVLRGVTPAQVGVAASAVVSGGGLSSAASTPLSKSSPYLFATPSPIALPPSSIAAAAASVAVGANANVRRKLLSSGSGSSAAAVASDKPLVCVGLPPSPSNTTQGEAGPVTRHANKNKMPPPSSVGEQSLTRAHSCGAAVPSYHKPLLPSFRLDGVDYVSSRTAALLLLAQRGRVGDEVTQCAPEPHEPYTAEQATALLGSLTAAEQTWLAEWRAAYDRVHVLDARFEYEYDGGHIGGAINVTTHAQAEDMLVKCVQGVPLNAAPAAAVAASSSPVPARTGSRVCVLIHCEFSKKRGPKCFSFLRQRDRMLNTHTYPGLHFPEMYVIAGGYLAFFTQNTAASSADSSPISAKPLAAAAAGAAQSSAPAAMSSSLARALCHPAEYVSMTDKRFTQAFATAWQRMTRSKSAPQPMSPAFLALLHAQGVTASPRHTAAAPSSGSGSGAGAADGGSGGSKRGCPPRVRARRNFSEMDGSGRLSPALSLSSACTNSAHSSPAFAQRSLSTSALSPPMILPSSGTAAGSMGSPLVPAPRPHRGLSLQLDNASVAPEGALSASASSAASSGFVVPPRRTQSAFSFHNSQLGATSGAGALGLARMPPPPPALQIPTSSDLGVDSRSGTPQAQTQRSPKLFGVGVPSLPLSAPSPSPTYGWSTEDRSMTPSPFGFPESPRLAAAASPLPASAFAQTWQSSPGSGSGAAGNGAAMSAAVNASVAANAGVPPSPRSLHAMNPPTFTSNARAASAAAASAAQAARAAQSQQSSSGYVSPFSFGGAHSFASPPQIHSRRTRASPASASASSTFSGVGERSQSVSLSASASASSLAAYSPSSLALQSMHLRGSPSLSMSSSFPLRSESTPSPSVMLQGGAVSGGGAEPQADEAALLMSPQLGAHNALSSSDLGLTGRDGPLAMDGDETPTGSASKRARLSREPSMSMSAGRRSAPRTILFPPSPEGASATPTPLDEETSKMMLIGPAATAPAAAAAAEQCMDAVPVPPPVSAPLTRRTAAALADAMQD